MNKIKKYITYTLFLFAVPLFVLVGGFVFKEKYYAFVSVAIAIISCIPLFYAFEKRDNTSKEIAVISVMVAISVVGRFIFAPVPGFKPVTAVTVIAGMYLGKESGFAVGALSAIISNIYFGQGPWTPFQMFSWGIIGFLAGVLAKHLISSKILLFTYGALAGVMFSFIMDIWTALWTDGTFNILRYGTAIVSAIPFTVEYAVSNIIFLWILNKPFGKKIQRIKTKYGLFLN